MTNRVRDPYDPPAKPGFGLAYQRAKKKSEEASTKPPSKDDRRPSGQRGPAWRSAKGR